MSKCVITTKIQALAEREAAKVAVKAAREEARLARVQAVADELKARQLAEKEAARIEKEKRAAELATARAITEAERQKATSGRPCPVER